MVGVIAIIASPAKSSMLVCPDQKMAEVKGMFLIPSNTMSDVYMVDYYNKIYKVL